MYKFLITMLYPIVVVLNFFLPVYNLTFFKKINKKELIIYSLILYIIMLFQFLGNFSLLHLFVMPVSTFLYIIIIYRKFIISIIICGFIWILASISDAINGAVLLYILGFQYSDIKANITIDFLSEISFVIITYILSKICRLILLKFFNKISFNFEIPNKFNLLFCVTLLICIFLIYQLYLDDFVTTWDGGMLLFNALTLSSFLFFFIAVVYYSFTILINRHKSQEYAQLKEYTNMIENMYSDIRSFRHDYLNILSTLAEYIENEDINGLKNYYRNDLLPESNEILNKNLSLSYLSHIKITPLKALLSSKIINAHSKGINVKVEMLDDIDTINMSIMDICRIMGILFDNAIEGAILCDDKFIHFAIVKTDMDAIFHISNSCLCSIPPIHKLYEKNFSTKGEGRGMGLNNVKEIVNNRYRKNVLFNTTIENCIFKQELIIKN